MMTEARELLRSTSSFRRALFSAHDAYSGDSADVIYGLFSAVAELNEDLAALPETDPRGERYASERRACETAAESAGRRPVSAENFHDLERDAQEAIDALGNLLPLLDADAGRAAHGRMRRRAGRRPRALARNRPESDDDRAIAAFLETAIRADDNLLRGLQRVLAGKGLTRQDEVRANDCVAEAEQRMTTLETKLAMIRRDTSAIGLPSRNAVTKMARLADDIGAVVDRKPRVAELIGFSRTVHDIVSGAGFTSAAPPERAEDDSGATKRSASIAFGERRRSPLGPATREASTLEDLLKIRHHNRSVIENVNGNLGSALGRKKTTDPLDPDNGRPAVIVFVPEKIAPKWVPADQMIPKEFHGPNGLYCCVDVVEGGKFDDYPLLYEDGTHQHGVVYWSDLQTLGALSPVHLDLRDRLRGWHDVITPGAQLSVRLPNGDGWYGTLGCFARDRSSGNLGIVTNKHVAHQKGTRLRFAGDSGRILATTERVVESITDENRFSGLIDEPGARFVVDCAFASLAPDVTRNELDSRVPVITNTQALQYLEMGSPVRLDLADMWPIGARVIGAGRTRSFQRGTIVGFAYEHRDVLGEPTYTDYLIAGDDRNEFSAPGDSGKLILTDEPLPRPIALLWGGWQERLSNVGEQQDWSYAIDIGLVLDQLDVDIVAAAP